MKIKSRELEQKEKKTLEKANTPVKDETEALWVCQQETKSTIYGKEDPLKEMKT